jgi:hypothetical protein
MAGAPASAIFLPGGDGETPRLTAEYLNIRPPNMSLF